MTKTKLVEDLKAYFATKGKFLSYAEYIAEEDTPFRVQIIKRSIGPWARLERMVGDIAPLPVVAPKLIVPQEPKPAKTPEKK